MSIPIETNDWTTIQKLCDINQGIITPSRLRWILKNHMTNGADIFSKRLGPKTILVSPSRFNEWFKRQKYYSPGEK